MQQLISGILTVVIVVALGLFLKWSADTGNWWWAFPVVILGTVALYFNVTDAAERRHGLKEVSVSVRRLFQRDSA